MLSYKFSSKMEDEEEYDNSKDAFSKLSKFKDNDDDF